MKKPLAFLCSVLLLLSVCLTGCNTDKSPLDKNNPVTVTMWHNYGGDMQQTMDLLIDEFNNTVGKEKGIVIEVTAVSSSADLNKNLTMIANDDPGAPECPDIFTGYPKIAVQFLDSDKLARLDEYFTDDELSAYMDAFVEEGRGSDGGLYVFPIAKSTEILYLNQTLFDEFSAATGVSEEQLATFEGLAELSIRYYEWTDGLTPDIADDGKAFFAADSWFNIALVGMEQLGSSMFDDQNALFLNNEAYKHIFETFFEASTRGAIAVYDGYSSDLSKTGDIVCSTGSSAGILFYGDTITYPDATVKQVEYSIMPYPVFEGGEKLALQRGGGLIVANTDEKREYAAVEFIKWLTAAEQNMRFIDKTGYLPVTKTAFESELQEHLGDIEDIRIKKMLTAVLSMYGEYSFFTAPTFAEFDSISGGYEEGYYNLMQKYVSEYKNGDEISPSDAYNEIIK